MILLNCAGTATYYGKARGFTQTIMLQAEGDVWKIASDRFRFIDWRNALFRYFFVILEYDSWNLMFFVHFLWMNEWMLWRKCTHIGARWLSKFELFTRYFGDYWLFWVLKYSPYFVANSATNISHDVISNVYELQAIFERRKYVRLYCPIIHIATLAISSKQY